MKRFFIIPLALMLAALMCASVFAATFNDGDMNAYLEQAMAAAVNRVYDSAAGSSTERVYDYMGYLNNDEIIALEQQIAAARTESGRDFIVVITDAADSTGQSGSETFADDFYDYNEFGESGYLFLIDMANRLMTISTKGDMIDYINDAREESIFDSAAPYMSSSDYSGACSAAIDKALAFYRVGIPEGQYRYEEDRSFFELLTPFEIIIALIAGAVAALIFAKSVKSKYNLEGSTYSYDIKNNTSLDLRVKQDQYVTTTVTSTLKKTDNDGGSGGGSGTHTSSSGSTHGGGSRGF